MAAAVKLRLDAALDEEPFADLAPRLGVRVGHAFLSEDPFYRFERRVHAAVRGGRASSPERRERARDRAWGAELRKVIREETVRTVWQPVVELESGSYHGFEAFARGPKDSMFEMPRAMFALSGRVGASGDLDRLCRSAAIRDGAGVGGRTKALRQRPPLDALEPRVELGGGPRASRGGRPGARGRRRRGLGARGRRRRPPSCPMRGMRCASRGSPWRSTTSARGGTAARRSSVCGPTTSRWMRRSCAASTAIWSSRRSSRRSRGERRNDRRAARRGRRRIRGGSGDAPQARRALRAGVPLRRPRPRETVGAVNAMPSDLPVTLVLVVTAVALCRSR